MKKLPIVKNPRHKRLYLATKYGVSPYKDSLNPLEITAIANTPEWGIVAATNPIQAIQLAAIHFPELNLNQNHE